MEHFHLLRFSFNPSNNITKLACFLFPMNMLHMLPLANAHYIIEQKKRPCFHMVFLLKVYDRITPFPYNLNSYTESIISNWQKLPSHTLLWSKTLCITKVFCRQKKNANKKYQIYRKLYKFSILKIYCRRWDLNPYVVAHNRF